MRVVTMIALVLLAGCAAKHETAGPGPYQRGVSTEAELVALRGQPQSRTVAADGTIEDIYVADFGIGHLFKPDPDGEPRFRPASDRS